MKKIIGLFFLFGLTATMLQSPLMAQGVDEDNTNSVFAFSDEIDSYFYKAYTDFLNDRPAACSNNLRKSAYFVRQAAANADEHNMKPVEKQAKRLESLADSISMGKIERPAKLRRAYAQTHKVLAKNYHTRAAAFWAGEQSEKAGKAIVSGAKHVQYGAVWTGEKIGKGAKAAGKGVAKGAKAVGKGTAKGAKAVGKGTVAGAKAVGKGTAKGAKAVGKGVATGGEMTYKGVRVVTGKMIKGIAFVPSKVGDALKWLGDGANKIGDKVEPAKTEKQLNKKMDRADKKAERKKKRKAKTGK